MRHQETFDRACGLLGFHPSSADGETQYEAGLYKPMAEPARRARNQAGKKLLFEDSRTRSHPGFQGGEPDSGRRQ
jgi:hypothetical protein